MQKETVAKLLQQHIRPHLAVILVGNDSSSMVYVNQKEKYGQKLGVKVTIYHFSASTDTKSFLHQVNSFVHKKEIHGAIIQRPVPLPIDKKILNEMVPPEKDVDGFHPQSRFTPPIANATLAILRHVFETSAKEGKSSISFESWIRKQHVLVIGRGETAGEPIAEKLKNVGAVVTIAHSQSKNMDETAKQSDIIVSCVGKPNIVRREMVSLKTILIGVGLHAENQKLYPDYNEEKIRDIVAFYTPVPGGVGPVNVACLFENVLKATSYQI